MVAFEQHTMWVAVVGVFGVSGRVHLRSWCGGIGAVEGIGFFR